MPEMVYVRNAGEFLTSLFKQADHSQLRKGIVHLDMWYDNMNIENEYAITVFDFDFCGSGWLLLDIAYFSMQLFQTEPDKIQFELKLKSFRESYEQITPLTEEERRLVPYAGLTIWIFYLGVQSQRFDNWSNIFLTNNYRKHYIGLVKGWLTYHHIELPTAD
jgi:Ser/Thr protein kinase RdoA (MazF antagonist)